MIKIDRDIKLGAKLLVNPGAGSHTKIPYTVMVIDFDKVGFKTKMVSDCPCRCCEPHERHFRYDSWEWENYHKQRFELA